MLEEPAKRIAGAPRVIHVNLPPPPPKVVHVISPVYLSLSLLALHHTCLQPGRAAGSLHHHEMGLGARAAVSSDGPEGPLPSAQAADALESRAAMTVASSPVLSSSFSYRGLQAAPPFFPVGFFALS